ncbi:hypothetical protein J3R83DRAFT_11013 [Lanmaoa asiatica]|nr:hypothetical protein J3R83DRAFT_11013 [Lanmaoa asiatica]
MTGNRPLDSEPRATNAGSGSRFTPAPQRVASRRSPVSLAPETKYELTLPGEFVAAQETPQNLIHSRSDSSSTRTNKSEVSHNSEDTAERVDSLIPKMSHLHREPGASARRRHPDSLKTDSGSLYSTDSAAARANLRKYGYGDSVPSSWSSLVARRESQLDLDRMYLPSSSGGPLSITPSRLTLKSSLQSDSASTQDTHANATRGRRYEFGR